MQTATTTTNTTTTTHVAWPWQLIIKPIDVAGQRVRPSVLGSTLLHPCTFLTPPPLPHLSLSLPSLGVALKNKNENIANCNTTQTKWQQKATQRSAQGNRQQAAAAQTVARGNIANRTEQSSLTPCLRPAASACAAKRATRMGWSAAAWLAACSLVVYRCANPANSWDTKSAIFGIVSQLNHLLCPTFLYSPSCSIAITIAENSTPALGQQCR